MLAKSKVYKREVMELKQPAKRDFTQKGQISEEQWPKRILEAYQPQTVQ